MFSSIRQLLNAIHRGIKRWIGWGLDGVRHVLAILAEDRVVLVAGLAVIAYVFSVLLLVEFPLRLGAALLFGAYATVVVRDMSFDDEDPKVSIGELRIAEDLKKTIVLSLLAMMTALMAARRVAFAVVVLIALFGVYVGRLMPEGTVYRRFREIPVVGETLLASIMSVFLVFALFFYNQLAAGPELVVLIFILAARFTVWHVLSEEEQEEDEMTLGEPDVPSTMIDVYGEEKTRNVLLGLCIASTLLFYALVVTGFFHEVAWFSGVSYLASIALLENMTPETRKQMADIIPILDTYIFALLTGLGWMFYIYILEIPVV